MKRYVDKSVYDATVERLTEIYRRFDEVYVSFSGGKDSGVLLHLCLRLFPERKINVFHLDYECQYDQTTEYVQSVWKENRSRLNVFHVCLPIQAQCACRMDAGFWKPWEKSKQELWVRQMPDGCINEDNHEGLWAGVDITDYDFNRAFMRWFMERSGTKSVCCLLGVRASESYTRHIKAMTDIRKFEGLSYVSELASGGCSAMPLYDWEVEDIWTANARFEFPYNKLYDLYYQAGLSVNEMRVASPFNDCAMASLKLYKTINPSMWGKMVSRVNGVNFAGIYGGTTAMGWRSITLPKGHTWQSYLKFLLSTLDEPTRFNYETRFATSLKFWQEKGGVLEPETIKQLKDCGVKLDIQENESGRQVVRFEEYPDDTAVDDFQSVPSFKRMVVCILKNDWYCKYMGFTPTKKEQSQRKSAMERYRLL